MGLRLTLENAGYQDFMHSSTLQMLLIVLHFVDSV
jgi:hypothetical protein